MAAGAVSAQDGNAERFCLHCRTTHTLLLHSSLLQGVDGLTATFALRNRQIDMGLWLHWMGCDSTGWAVTPLIGRSTDLTVVQLYLLF